MTRMTIGVLLVIIINIFTILPIFEEAKGLSISTVSKQDELNCSQHNLTLTNEIHVDNQLGNNNYSGTKECPFRSVDEALKVSRDGDTIILHEGVYYEEIFIENFENLTIRKAENNRVVFDGTSSIIDDLNGTWIHSSNEIYEVEIDQKGWQVFVDYKEQVPARWPNANFTDFSVFDQTNNWAKGTIDEGGNYINGELQDNGKLSSSGIDPVGAIAILNVGSFKTWSRTINDYDSTNNTLLYDQVPNWKTKHHHYFLEGKRELIDVPGEWWFDSSVNKLHMKFENGTNPNNLDIRVKTQAYAFNITNSNNISIEGLEFFGTTFNINHCNGCVVRDSDFMYPSTSKRGLGIVGEDVEERWVSRMDFCTNSLIDNSSFAYTDGSALEFHGASLKSHNNTVNNTHFEYIDWSSSDLIGLMVTIYDGGKDNTFSNNTVKNTGASSTLSIGDSPKIFFNNISNTGLIQSDGAVVQMMMLEQQGAQIAYNWIHNTEKYGIRMDGPAGGINLGRNATIHHNVLWNIKTGIMAKGDYHEISYNTVFGGGLDLGKNDIIILFENGEGNENSSTNNNAADKISAHRSKSYEEHPVKGYFIDNYNGYQEELGEVENYLLDPDNYDFRPINNSALDNLSAGAYQASDPDPWEPGAERKWIIMQSLYKGCTNISAKNYDYLAGIHNHECMFDVEIQPEPEPEPDGHCLIIDNLTVNETYFVTLDLVNTCDKSIHYPGVNATADHLLVSGFPDYVEWYYLIFPHTTYNHSWQLYFDEAISNGTEISFNFEAAILSCEEEGYWHDCPDSTLEYTFTLIWVDNETEEDSKTEQFIEFHNETDDLDNDDNDGIPNEKFDLKKFYQDFCCTIGCGLLMGSPFLLWPKKEKSLNKVEVPPKSIILENLHEKK